MKIETRTSSRTFPRTRNHARPTLSRALALGALAAAVGTAASAQAKANPHPKANPEVHTALAEIEQAAGGFVPAFLKALPENALPGAWAEIKGIWVDNHTALPCKIKDIIAVAVGSQIPQRGLVDGHTAMAKAAGATFAEIAEGVTIAAMARKWSTFFNGVQLDETKFRAEINRLVQGAKAAAAAGGPPPGKPIAVVDAKSAQEDMKQNFGFVPEFAQKFPANGLAGAWREMRDVEMNPQTALSGKYKSLVSLAVASQIPCRYCIIADTEFAKLEGATDAEITEAVAMAGLVRHTATAMVGLGIDDATYRSDMQRVAQHIAKMSAAATPSDRGGKTAGQVTEMATTTTRR